MNNGNEINAKTEENITDIDDEDNSNEEERACEIVKYVKMSKDCIKFEIADRYNVGKSSGSPFVPTFTHQFFEEENIFGYESIEILFKLSPCNLNVLLTVNVSGVIKKDYGEPDVVQDFIYEKTKHRPTDDVAEFRRILMDEEDFLPFGTKLHEFTIENDGQKRSFEVFHNNHMSLEFMEFIENMQFLMMWFIDGACYSNYDDESWHYYILYEKIVDTGNSFYPVVGLCAIYNYYMFPDLEKPRIAQFFILPPYQRLGLGLKFLQTIMSFLRNDPSVGYVTVEDATPEFKRIIIMADALACHQLPCFKPEFLQRGFSVEMKKAARDLLKLDKKRTSWAYEVLRLASLDRFDSNGWKSLRLDFKNRLYNLFQMNAMQKQKRELSKKSLSNGQPSSSSSDKSKPNKAPPNDEERYKILQDSFDNLISDYQIIINRLNQCKDYNPEL